MLAGRRDVGWISTFNSSFKQFSDNGENFHGAYGHRWRKHFYDECGKPIDQITEAIEILRKNPKDRRAVLQMWDPVADLGKEGLDFPCNLSIAFRIREPGMHKDGELDMTVFNRSNDIIWGAYGANSVHMSMLQEYMAACIGVMVGKYYQVSNNYHAYEEALSKVGNIHPMPIDPYDTHEVRSYPMVEDARTWHVDLLNFIDNPREHILYSNSFFSDVAVPMAAAQHLFKQGALVNALESCKLIMATDWRRACEEWLKRRILKKEETNAENTSGRQRETISHVADD